MLVDLIRNATLSTDCAALKACFFLVGKFFPPFADWPPYPAKAADRMR
jgi:hypothetical protein